MSGCREDLAYIHDAGFGRLAEAGARRTVDLLRRRGVASGRIVELGCGSGITAAALSDAGYAVVGVDQSPSLLELARRRAPRAVFHQGSFVDFDIPASVAVVAIGEVLNYRFDRHNDLRALGSLFARVHRSLHAHGLFVFDVAGSGRLSGGSDRTWMAGDDWAVLVDAAEDRATATLTRRITTFRRVAGAYRRDEETHELLLHRPTELARMLRSCGFRARILTGYDGRPFAPGHRVLVASPRR